MGPDPSEISAQEHRIKLCMNGLLRLVVKSTLGVEKCWIETRRSQVAIKKKDGKQKQL